MASLIEQKGAPWATLAKSGSLSGTGQSPWMSIVGQGRERVFVANVEDLGSAAGTFVVEAQMAMSDGSFGATQTLFSSSTLTDFPKVGRLAGNWQVRVRCSSYGAGNFNLSTAQ